MERATTVVEEGVSPPAPVMPKGIIHVEGGLVQAVYSKEELDIQVYDLDMSDFATKTEIESIKAIAAEFKTEIKNMQQIY